MRDLQAYRQKLISKAHKIGVFRTELHMYTEDYMSKLLASTSPEDVTKVTELKEQAQLLQQIAFLESYMIKSKPDSVKKSVFEMVKKSKPTEDNTNN